MSKPGRLMSRSLGAMLLLGAVTLHPVFAAPAPKGPPLPRIDKLPDNLPTSKLPQTGEMQSVRITARNLKAAVTKPCDACKGEGTIKSKGGGPGFARPERSRCGTCNGTGRLPNDPA